MDYTKTVEITNQLLIDNTEWVIRYQDYEKKININKTRHENGRSKFRIFSPFYLYTSITNLLQDNVLNYDLRFLGQSVASIKIKHGGIIITTNNNKDASNRKYFGVDIPLRDEKWNSYKTKKFRREFSKCNSDKGRSKEHKIESALLSEFKKSGKKQKALYNIQPILLANSFFQMATPIKASLTEIDYVGAKGGGIDILSRVRHKDNITRLCVMELKDENIGSEPPRKVMNQAIAYATFIANLLRSRSGDKWYELFGFSGSVPNTLIIDVSIVMPYPQQGASEDFNSERIEVLKDTFIELHSLYFKEKAKLIGGYDYEFSGSLKEAMMK